MPVLKSAWIDLVEDTDCILFLDTRWRRFARRSNDRSGGQYSNHNPERETAYRKDYAFFQGRYHILFAAYVIHSRKHSVQQSGIAQDRDGKRPKREFKLAAHLFDIDHGLPS